MEPAERIAASIRNPALSHQDVILKRIRDIPSLPEVVNHILSMLGQADTPASQIAKLIAYDPGLTSKVLRMVNSSAYGFQRQISSIQHAIMILGFNTVRGIVLSASIFKLFENRTHPNGLDHRAFWEHSLSTAVAARLLAKTLSVPDVDEVFSAAMLHDIGKVVLDVHLPAYQQIMQEANKRRIRPHGEIFRRLEMGMLEMSHDSIGALLATKWKLPIGMTEVIQFHHQPALAENCTRLVYLVALANEMATALHHEHAGQESVFSESHFTLEVVEFFNLDTEKLEVLFRQVKDELGSAKELLDSISV